MATNDIDLTVVIPVYNEQENLLVLYERLSHVLKDLKTKNEIIFVDDGSTDQTSAILTELAKKDNQVSVIEFARNFGQQRAYSAGLQFARGKAVVAMDADLQDPPEVIPDFIQYWKQGYEVVYAQRINRKEGLLKRSAYALFYRFLQLIADVRIPKDAGDFCLMDQQVVSNITEMRERSRFLRGLRSWVGFRQIGIPIERHAREGGHPKYNFFSLISLALNGIVSFSIKPLRIITFFGSFVAFCSVGLAVYYTLQKVTVGLSPPGLATIVVLLSFLSGIQLMTIGIIGEYVGRIFEETKDRPLYIIKRRFGTRFENMVS